MINAPKRNASANIDHQTQAERLQSECAPNAVLVSNNTRALVADSFQFVSRGALSLKGIGEGIDAFEVLFAIDDASTADAPADH